MSETLLDIAKRHLRAVDLILAGENGEDSVLCDAMYLTQQAAELYCKHHLELRGIEYKKTHNIRSLLRLGDIPGYSVLEPIADTLTEWESNTRYITGYVSDRELLLRILPKVKQVVLSTSINDYEQWFQSLSDVQKELLKALNPSLYNMCCNGLLNDPSVQTLLRDVIECNPVLR